MHLPFRIRLAKTLIASSIAIAARCAGAGTIAPDLQAIMQATSPSRRIPVVIRLQSQADVATPAATGATRLGCVQAVERALKDTATATQNTPAPGHPLGLLDELRAVANFAVRDIRPFWITNAIAVSATSPVIESCAAREDVDTIAYGGPLTFAAPRPEANTPTWNVTQVRAPEVWALGIRGAGSVVAAIDTGASVVNLVLAANPVRTTGGQPLWHDAVKGWPNPYDESGHGSHVLGVAVGAGGIGVAPDARWIACKAFKRGKRNSIAATAAQILDCGQWILNPDEPLAPDPGHLADVVVNPSWLLDPGACDPFFQNMVRAWRACGMLPVFAVGDAPGVAPDDAVPSPANYPEAFSVGAADANDEPLPSSFHGTAACGTSPRAAPRLVASGADITSAGRGTRLESRTGTDAAAPHAAGAAALLRSAFPDLTVDRMDEILQRSAKDFVPGPDPPYRPGRLDAFTAVTFEDARFISRVAPAGTRVTGEVLRSVSVTMRNSGVTTWQRGVHALAPVNPDLPTFGVTRVNLPVAEVPPGAEVVFTFDITMPQVPNLAPGYNFQWQMVHEGVGFFGDPTPSVNVPVRGINEASLVNQNPPPQLMPGECTPVSVAFQNLGTNAWTKAAGYRLGSQNPQDNTTWGLNRVDLLPSDVIPPGGTKTFTFNACAPLIQGNYDFEWRMVQDGVEWFGQFSPNVVVTVTGNDNATSCGSSGVPAELRVGQPADVTICLQNTGTNAWIGGYCLVAMQPGFWGPSSVCLGPGEAVVQNQARNFSFRITAPNRPGRWDFGFQLDRGDGHRFGSFATTIAIPLDFQANSCFSSTQGACSWFFRHYDPAGLGWPKMTFAGDHWQGPGPNQQIRANTASPGDQPVARFWKSAFASNVRISGEVHDLDGSCGDGVHFFLRKNKGPRNLIWDTIVNNGDAAPHSFSFEKWVDVNDTIRLIVQKRSTTGCDTTFFDPLIQVLPSDAVGAIPGAQAIIDPLVEPD